ncbi:hypothetical protein D9M73_274980 [compost metagenome]
MAWTLLPLTCRCALLLMPTEAPLSSLATWLVARCLLVVVTTSYATPAAYWRDSGLPSSASWVCLALAVKPRCWSRVSRSSTDCALPISRSPLAST